jgi:hypothetical protein
MLRYSLKTIDKLDKVEEKEKQQREEGRTATAAATVSNKLPVLELKQFKVNPFTGLNIPLLPSRV